MTAMTDLQQVIETKDLSVRFGRTEALADLSFAVPTGSIFALIGPNGAGKTTLIKTLLNLREPTGGTASVLGVPSTAIHGRALERIGYVSENQELPGWMTLEQFLAYLRPFYPAWDTTLERALLTQFRLPGERKIKQMSRGQQMKTALLGALAYRPSLLVLDEPFSGLDPLARDEFIVGLLDRMAAQEEHPMTVLLSSHDLAEIESFATHVGYLEQGRLLFAEEIATLTERFREVTVVFEGVANGEANLQAKLKAMPQSWLVPEQSASFLRFVHSQATKEPVQQQIDALLPHAMRIESEPMALRSIFLALARAGSAQSLIPDARSRA